MRKGEPTRQRSRHLLASVMVILALLWVDGCVLLTGIPDIDTPDGRVFAQRCGACHGMVHEKGHGVPDPRFRTMAEWETILPKMEERIRERGRAPLGESEREAIIRYLGQHAKS